MPEAFVLHISQVLFGGGGGGAVPSHQSKLGASRASLASHAFCLAFVSLWALLDDIECPGVQQSSREPPLNLDDNVQQTQLRPNGREVSV